jgi:hypothetical protein
MAAILRGSPKELKSELNSANYGLCVQWKIRPALIATVWPAIVSVRHIVTTVVAPRRLEAPSARAGD